MQSAPMVIEDPKRSVDVHVELNTDVLASIFEINTNPFAEPNALNHLRVYAQVCRAWRLAAFDSPHLWGRVIDMDILSRQKSRDWADEVLRRAGPTSSLWIKGVLAGRDAVAWIKGEDGIIRMKKCPSSSLEFFFSLVKAHWSRVQRFVITLETRDIRFQPWGVICRPSPRLQEFDLSGCPESISADLQGRLFAKEAPRLTTLRLMNVLLDIRGAPWLRSVRSLSFDIQLSLSDVLEILDMARQLEFLWIVITSRNDGFSLAQRPSPIQMLNCRHAQITSAMKPSVNFLASVVFQPHCLVEMNVTDCAFFPSSAASQAASNLSHICNPSAQSRLRIDFTLEAISTKLFTDVQAGLSICLQEGRTRVSSDGRRLVEIFPNLNVATELDLEHLNHINSSRTSGQSDPRSRWPVSTINLYVLLKIIESIPSTRILATTIWGIKTLSDFQQRNPASILLPALEVLRMKKYSASSDRTALSLFIRMRRDAGAQISVLDLSGGDMTWKDEPGLVLSLGPKIARFVGLRVLWRQDGAESVQEYVC